MTAEMTTTTPMTLLRSTEDHEKIQRIFWKEKSRKVFWFLVPQPGSNNKKSFVPILAKDSEESALLLREFLTAIHGLSGQIFGHGDQAVAIARRWKKIRNETGWSHDSFDWCTAFALLAQVNKLRLSTADLLTAWCHLLVEGGPVIHHF
jgi:hypothetical protein